MLLRFAVAGVLLSPAALAQQMPEQKVIVKPVLHGAGIVVGYKSLALRCQGNQAILTLGNGMSVGLGKNKLVTQAISLTIRENRVARITARAKPLNTLAELELQLTCQAGIVVMKAGPGIQVIKSEL